MRMLGGPILLVLTCGSQYHKLTLIAHIKSSESDFSRSSSVTRLLHKRKSSPWTCICRSMTIWSRQTPKSSIKWLKKFKIPLDPVQPESILCVDPSKSPSKFRPFPPSFTSGHSPRSGSSSITTPQFPLCHHATKKCLRPFWVSMPIKSREQKKKAVVLDEVTMNAADGNGSGGARR